LFVDIGGEVEEVGGGIEEAFLDEVIEEGLGVVEVGVGVGLEDDEVAASVGEVDEVGKVHDAGDARSAVAAVGEFGWCRIGDEEVEVVVFGTVGRGRNIIEDKGAVGWVVDFVGSVGVVLGENGGLGGSSEDVFDSLVEE
jgi:hypothetical protein